MACACTQYSRQLSYKAQLRVHLATDPGRLWLARLDVIPALGARKPALNPAELATDGNVAAMAGEAFWMPHLPIT